MAEQTLNIPSILVFIIVTVLAVRWYTRSNTATSNNPQASSTTGATVRINAAQVEQISQMFPQLQRRSIAWELHRNGGNVAAVTEKVLSGRSLETPPPSFTLPTPLRSTTNTPTSRTPTPAAKAVSKPDLISRYNLSSKLANSASETSATTSEGEQPVKPKAWSQDRNERQSNLQRRREEMILAARRKMEEKDRAKA
ncbi:unnamed protein product [Periconia digitata]|uniref:Coupling of ubiquitin conjugation to ER degradation protein 1 n=1 Tax=Periconia digitata TaxID=1303443 RepID=A0A9W4UK22_9PLEO|nr:unnamed protein product [Periconia digitata]